VIGFPSQPYYPTTAGGLPPPWLEGWAGFGGTNNWYGGWAGFNYAFNHNVWSEGLLLRGEGQGGHYDYTNSTVINGLPVVPGGFVNATYGTGAVLLGWRHIVPGVGLNTIVTGYVGAEVQDQMNPDPSAAVRGTKWGAKFIGEMYSRLSPYQDFYGQGSFSFAFDTWFLLARPGFLLTAPTSNLQVWVGPEGQAFGIGQGWLQNQAGCPNNAFFVGTGGGTGGLGSCKYDEGRVGGFVHFVMPDQPLWGDWIISGGYRKPLLANSGGDGYYAQIGLYFHLH
jgi:Cellulose biosynthesis protein BcsS